MKLVRIFITSLLLATPFMLSASNDDCLACHNDSGLKSSAGKPVFVSPEKFLSSVHGRAEIACIDCHTDLKNVKDFPHPEKLKAVNCAACHEKAAQKVTASIHGQPHGPENPIIVTCKDCHGTHEIYGRDDTESRTFSMNLPATCESCHLERVKTKAGNEFIRGYNQSVHYRALEKSGLTLSANCTSCHGAHEVRSVTDPLSSVARKSIIHTCGQCHVGIEKGYLEGVHGKDYVKGIKDVPVCTDCHSEHDITAPQELNSKVYTTKVAQVCSNCHDNLRLAREYGFLPYRLRTYSESYHGTASKFGETRVANCASCHGFHDIRASSDPESSVHPDNLPKTCGKCHAGATKHFAEGKIHFIAEETITTKYRSAHIVKNVYIIVITVIIGVFLLFIASDLMHRAINKKKHE